MSESLNLTTLPLLGGVDLVVHKDGKTFVEFDCNRFRQMELSADLILTSKLITPADSSKEKEVKAHIETVVKDANDMMAHQYRFPHSALKALMDLLLQ